MVTAAEGASSFYNKENEVRHEDIGFVFNFKILGDWSWSKNSKLLSKPSKSFHYYKLIYR